MCHGATLFKISAEPLCWSGQFETGTENSSESLLHQIKSRHGFHQQSSLISSLRLCFIRYVCQVLLCTYVCTF